MDFQKHSLCDLSRVVAITLGLRDALMGPVGAPLVTELPTSYREHPLSALLAELLLTIAREEST